VRANLAWTALWLAVAGFGAVPIAAGIPGVAGVYWAGALIGLAYTWAVPRGRHRAPGTAARKHRR